MLAPPTHHWAVVFVGAVELVVRLLYTFATIGFEMWDAHPGNFGFFAGEDLKVIDWADIRIHTSPAGALISKLMSAGFRKLRKQVAGPHCLHADVPRHPAWSGITGGVASTLLD